MDLRAAMILCVILSACSAPGVMDSYPDDVLDPLIPPRQDCIFPDPAQLEELAAKADSIVLGAVTGVTRDYPFPKERRSALSLPNTRFTFQIEVERHIKPASASASTTTVNFHAQGDLPLDHFWASFLETGQRYVLFLGVPPNGRPGLIHVTLGRYTIERERVFLECSAIKGEDPARGPRQGMALEDFIKELQS